MGTATDPLTREHRGSVEGYTLDNLPKLLPGGGIRKGVIGFCFHGVLCGFVCVILSFKNHLK